MSSINGVAIAPDGSSLYIVADIGEPTGILWVLDIASGTLNSGTSVTLDYLSTVVRISPDGETVYIADDNVANVVVYDTKTEAVSYLGTLTVVPGIATSSDSQHIFLANLNTHPVDLIYLNTKTVTGTVTAGDVAGAFVKDSDGKLLVLNANSANLALVNEHIGSTQAALVLKLPGFSIFTGALAKGGLFFADLEDLFLLNLQTHAVQKLVIPSNDCYAEVNGLAASLDGSRVFATTFNDGGCMPPNLPAAKNSQIPDSGLNVYDGSTGSLLQQVALNNPGALVIGPNGKFAWIVTSDAPSMLSLRVVNLTTLKTVADYPVRTAGSLKSLAITPNGEFLYATDSKRALIHVIATQSGQEVATISAGVTPTEIAITPDGSSAFVTDKGSTSLTTVDTVSNTVSATIDVGAASRPIVFIDN